MGGWFSVLMTGFFGFLFNTLAARSWGRSLLLRHPKFFTRGLVSHAGPTEAQMRETSFSLTIYGRGYSDAVESSPVHPYDREVVVKVSGPEPGYVATPIIMVHCAVQLLKAKGLPISGGVYSTAACFRGTDLVEELCKRGVNFEVLESTK